MYHGLLIPSSFDGHLDCFWLLWIKLLLWTFVYQSSCGHVFCFPWVSISKWNCWVMGVYVFKFLRAATWFSKLIALSYYQQWARVSVFPYSCQHLVLLVFLNFGLYLVIFWCISWAFPVKILGGACCHPPQGPQEVGQVFGRGGWKCLPDMSPLWSSWGLVCFLIIYFKLHFTLIPWLLQKECRKASRSLGSLWAVLWSLAFTLHLLGYDPLVSVHMHLREEDHPLPLCSCMAPSSCHTCPWPSPEGPCGEAHIEESIHLQPHPFGRSGAGSRFLPCWPLSPEQTHPQKDNDTSESEAAQSQVTEGSQPGQNRFPGPECRPTSKMWATDGLPSLPRLEAWGSGEGRKPSMGLGSGPAILSPRRRQPVVGEWGLWVSSHCWRGGGDTTIFLWVGAVLWMGF